MTVREILDLDIGSVIRMNRSAGENIDISIGGSLVGFGEIVIIEDTMGSASRTSISRSDMDWAEQILAISFVFLLRAGLSGLWAGEAAACGCRPGPGRAERRSICAVWRGCP